MKLDSYQFEFEMDPYLICQPSIMVENLLGIDFYQVLYDLIPAFLL